MSDKSEPSARKIRVDAERNRVRLLEAAKSAFAEKGTAASLEDIAREAGVGIGTLYRHFPTRDALIEAVYRNETDQFLGAAARLSETLPPMEALRQSLLLAIDYLAAKRGMADVLNSLVGGTSELYAVSGTRMKQVMGMLFKAAADNGDIRADVDPFDLLRALAGVATIGAGPDGNDAAKRFVDVLMAGISTRA